VFALHCWHEYIVIVEPSDWVTVLGTGMDPALHLLHDDEPIELANDPVSQGLQDELPDDEYVCNGHNEHCKDLSELENLPALQAKQFTLFVVGSANEYDPALQFSQEVEPAFDVVPNGQREHIKEPLRALNVFASHGSH